MQHKIEMHVLHGGGTKPLYFGDLVTTLKDGLALVAMAAKNNDQNISDGIYRCFVKNPDGSESFERAWVLKGNEITEWPYVTIPEEFM